MKKEINLKQVLLDPQNHENIISGGISYLQVFSVVLKNTKKAYSILRVLRTVEGCEPNEAFVYLIDNNKLSRVKSNKIIREVFKLYYRSLRGEEVDAEFACVKMHEEIYKPYSVNSMESERKNTRTIQKYNAMMQLYKELTSEIKGQNAVIMRFIKTLFGASNIPNSRGPKVFTLLGAPGIGKTMLIQALPKHMDVELVYINCTVFVERESVFLLMGIPPSYKDSHGGIVTLCILKTPYRSIILFDEIDKAHANVRAELFLALDQGRLYDNFLRYDVDLSEAIFVFASNAGECIYKRPGIYNLSDTPKEVIIEALRRERDSEGKITFPDALISRFSSGDMIVMNNLAPIHVREILVDEIHRRADDYRHHEDINFRVDAEQLADLLIYKNINNLDIRNMKKQILDYFATQTVYSKNMIGELYPESYVDEIVCGFDICGKDKEVDKMIKSDKKPKILLLGKSGGAKPIHKIESAEIIEGSIADIDNYVSQKNGFEMVLFDATYSMSEAKKAFDIVKERSNVPMFVFSRNKLAMADLFYFLENGIDDYHIPSCDVSLDSWIEKLALGIIFNSICNKLAKKRKAITFSETHCFDDKTKRLYVNADATVKDIFARAENGKIISRDKETRYKIAVHEAGHVLVGATLERPADFATIESRGSIGGYVMTD